jgi:hypothetical protein
MWRVCDKLKRKIWRTIREGCINVFKLEVPRTSPTVLVAGVLSMIHGNELSVVFLHHGSFNSGPMIQTPNFLESEVQEGGFIRRNGLV